MDESTALATVSPDDIDEFLDVVPAAGGETRSRARVSQDAQRALIGGLYTMRYPRADIARIANVSINTVDRVLARLRKDKQLRAGLEDVLQRVEDEALPLAMESLLEHLGKHDKDMTLEVLKGRGVFRNYNSNRVEGGGPSGSKPFVVNIINQPNAAAIPVPSDAIKGTPRQLGAPDVIADIET